MLEKIWVNCTFTPFLCESVKIKGYRIKSMLNVKSTCPALATKFDRMTFGIRSTAWMTEFRNRMLGFFRCWYGRSSGRRGLGGRQSNSRWCRFLILPTRFPFFGTGLTQLADFGKDTLQILFQLFHTGRIFDHSWRLNLTRSFRVLGTIVKEFGHLAFGRQIRIVIVWSKSLAATVVVIIKIQYGHTYLEKAT